jgi:hypothetical protein
MSSAYVNIFKLMQIGRGTPPPDFLKKRERFGMIEQTEMLSQYYTLISATSREIDRITEKYKHKPGTYHRSLEGDLWRRLVGFTMAEGEASLYRAFFSIMILSPVGAASRRCCLPNLTIFIFL